MCYVEENLLSHLAGEMDLAESFPLSRFAAKEEEVVLKFAVGGAHYESYVNAHFVYLHFMFLWLPLLHNGKISLLW